MTLFLKDNHLLWTGSALAASQDCCCIDCPPDCSASCTAWQFKSNQLDENLAGHLEISENLLGFGPNQNWAVTGWIKGYCSPQSSCNDLIFPPGVNGTIFSVHKETSPVNEQEMSIEIIGNDTNLAILAAIRLRTSDGLTCDVAGGLCFFPFFSIGEDNLGRFDNYQCDCIFFGLGYEERSDTDEPRLHVWFGGNTLNLGSGHADVADLPVECSGESGCRFRPGQVDIKTRVGTNAFRERNASFAVSELTIWDNVLDIQAMEDLEQDGPGLMHCNKTVQVATWDDIVDGPAFTTTVGVKNLWCATQPDWRVTQIDQCAGKKLSYVPP